MRLSVIILTYNQREVTMRCLSSLEYLVGQDDTEIIVVDNGSIDSTGDSVRNQYPGIRYIRSEKNLGVAGGRNLGLRKARGEYLLILDNDTIVPQGAIESLIDYLESHKDVGLVAPRLIGPEGETQLSARPYPGIWAKMRSVLGILPKASESPEDSEPCYVIGAAQMFRRKVYEKVGALDDKIFYGPEDADFCIRVRKAGYRVVYHPAVAIRHEYRRISRKNPFSRMAMIHARALLYFYCKHRKI